MNTPAPPTASDAVLLRRAADRRFDEAEAFHHASEVVRAEKAEREAAVLYRWAAIAAKGGGRCHWQPIVTYARAVLGCGS